MADRFELSGPDAKSAFEPLQFLRFFATGVIATLANMATVWAAGLSVAYGFALLAGIAVGSSVSFLLSKLFVFRSRSWSPAAGEMVRFAIVYGFGLLVYLPVSFSVSAILVANALSVRASHMGGVFCGAGLMTLTSYFGHRLFTYKFIEEV
jgi:putative flippase GtrA